MVSSNMKPGACLLSMSQSPMRFSMSIANGPGGVNRHRRRACVIKNQTTRPHGMKLLGTRFITDVSGPVSIVVRTAGHEMFHPPFDRQDAEVSASIALLRGKTLF